MSVSRILRALAVILLVLLVSPLAASGDGDRRWNRKDLSQFGSASAGFFVTPRYGISCRSGRASPARLWVPCPSGKLTLVVRAPCQGMELHTAAAEGGPSRLIVREIPTPAPDTRVEIRRTGKGLVVSIGYREYVHRAVEGDFGWIVLVVDPGGALTIRDVVWPELEEANPPQDGDRSRETIVGGVLKDNQTWSGVVRLGSDVHVPRGVTLRLEPGTRVVAAAGNPTLPTIGVRGRIEAVGSEHLPIRFGETPVRPGEAGVATWQGIVLHSGRDRESRFAHCVFRGASAAIRSPGGSPRIEDSTFLDCRLGIGPGRALVSRCVFFACGVGISEAGGGLGPVVSRCDFHTNDVAVEGPGSITDSIFSANDLVFQASRLHRDFAAATDRYHRSGNVYWNNARFADEDIPPGAWALFDDPGYVGPMPASAEDRLDADLPERLALAPGAPARWRATDGGDPGAFGKPGAGLSPARLDGQAGVPLREWVIPGPPNAGDVLPAPGSFEVPRPGTAVEGVVWCRVRAEEDGILRLPASAVRTADGGVVLAANVTFRRPGPARILLGLDGALVSASFNEQDLPCPGERREYAADDLRFDVKGREGRNRLVLRIRAGRPRPRISARVLPGAEIGVGGVVAAGPPAPRPAPVSIERVAVERGFLTIVYDGPVHWIDVADPAFVRVAPATASARPVTGRATRYDPGPPARVVVTGLELSEGTLEVGVGRIRDAWGRPVQGGRFIVRTR